MLQLSPRAAAYGLACLVAAALASDVLWMPIQVTDSLGEIVANAVLSFAYTKDEVMSTAGIFYALAAFGGMRAALAWPRPGVRDVRWSE